jgi:hypothetical protein
MKLIITILFNLTFLFAFIACSKNIDQTETNINDSTESQIIHVDLHENDPIHFFIPANIEAEGKLTLIDSIGEELNYNIINGDNTIEVPFGIYKGNVHGFIGFNNDSLIVKSLGDGITDIHKAAIGRIPNFNYRILNHEVENAWYYLITNCDTNLGYYTFSVWGSNDDTTNTNSFDKIAAYHMAIDTNGNVRLLIADLNLNQLLYKYYNISLAPLYGYMEDTVFTSWYTLLN